jgi:hypothetical protein
VYSLKTATGEVVVMIAPKDGPAMSITLPTMALSQSKHASIRNGRALDETYSPQFWKRRQFHDGHIGQVNAASQIYVSNPVAGLYQLDNGCISDMPAVAKVEVMKVFSELADSVHCKICKISALCKDQISQSRSDFNDLFHSPVC